MSYYCLRMILSERGCRHLSRTRSIQSFKCLFEGQLRSRPLSASCWNFETLDQRRSSSPHSALGFLASSGTTLSCLLRSSFFVAWSGLNRFFFLQSRPLLYRLLRRLKFRAEDWYCQHPQWSRTFDCFGVYFAVLETMQNYYSYHFSRCFLGLFYLARTWRSCDLLLVYYGTFGQGNAEAAAAVLVCLVACRCELCCLAFGAKGFCFEPSCWKSHLLQKGSLASKANQIYQLKFFAYSLQYHQRSWDAAAAWTNFFLRNCLSSRPDSQRPHRGDSFFLLVNHRREFEFLANLWRQMIQSGPSCRLKPSSSFNDWNFEFCATFHVHFHSVAPHRAHRPAPRWNWRTGHH